MTNRRVLGVVEILTGIVLLLTAACREVDGTLYSKFADLPSGGWPRYESRCFTPDSVLAGRTADLTLTARARASHPLAPVPVIVSVEDETGPLACDTLRLRLFDADGRPQGKTRFGICEREFLLKRKLKVRKGLSICLLPLAPEHLTAGMLNIGITLKDHESDTSQP